MKSSPGTFQFLKLIIAHDRRQLGGHFVVNCGDCISDGISTAFIPGQCACHRDADEVLEQAATSEEFDRLCEAVRLLPVQARRVFVLKKVYGYSQREIAAELGLAQSTVEKHIALAVRRCARYMSEQTSEVLTRPYRAEAHHE